MASKSAATFEVDGVTMRRCIRCKEILPLDTAFSRGEYRCQPCTNANNRERFANFNARLAAIKMAAGCADCGYAKHPAALDFDHLPGHEKLINIGAKGYRVSWEKVEAEIAKCEVVCSNCHRIRTAERREAGRAK